MNQQERFLAIGVSLLIIFLFLAGLVSAGLLPKIRDNQRVECLVTLRNPPLRNINIHLWECSVIDRCLFATTPLAIVPTIQISPDEGAIVLKTGGKLVEKPFKLGEWETKQIRMSICAPEDNLAVIEVYNNEYTMIDSQMVVLE